MCVLPAQMAVLHAAVPCLTRVAAPTRVYWMQSIARRVRVRHVLCDGWCLRSPHLIHADATSGLQASTSQTVDERNRSVAKSQRVRAWVHRASPRAAVLLHKMNHGGTLSIRDSGPSRGGGGLSPKRRHLPWPTGNGLANSRPFVTHSTSPLQETAKHSCSLEKATLMRYVYTH
jgi:hypothetical protein